MEKLGKGETSPKLLWWRIRLAFFILMNRYFCKRTNLFLAWKMSCESFWIANYFDYGYSPLEALHEEWSYL